MCVLCSNSGIKFNTSDKWAKEIMVMTWELIHEIWLEKNKIKHDYEGQLEKQKKRK
jgi:hypothetical protein